MRQVPRRLAALFGVAALGVLVVVGIALGELAGGWAVAVWVALLAVALAVVVLRARRAAPPAAQPHRCSCCDGDHTAPVRVV